MGEKDKKDEGGQMLKTGAKNKTKQEKFVLQFGLRNQVLKFEFDRA